jgi:prepilin-type N-terminal cleavage/methylation domain-containing protein/prepilin-type processing-associated H-X9-DG protein
MKFSQSSAARAPKLRSSAIHGTGGRRFAPPPAGFTLIELLVTISIVTILAALLFPVFARVRENTRRTNCASNQKQLALGLRIYVQDHDDIFVPSGDVFTSPGGWSERLEPYVKGPQLLQCPSEGTPQENFALDYTDYYYNLNLGPKSGNSVNDASMEYPTTTIVLGEGTSRESDYSCSGLGQNECYFSLFSVTVPASAANRHFEGANYAFADGHVKWLPPSAIAASSVKASSDMVSFRF